MGKTQNQQGSEADLKQSKSSFFEKYKKKAILRTKMDLELYNNSSPSAVFFHRFVNNALDILGWVLLIGALYLYIKSGRGETLACNDLPQLLQSCQAYLKNQTVQIGGVNIPLM